MLSLQSQRAFQNFLWFLLSQVTNHLRLVFTTDGVVIRRAERYDLVKIKPTESEAKHWFCLCLRRLWSSENCFVGVASRSGRINQWQFSIPGLAIGWSFRFCFRLRQPSFHLIMSDGVVNGMGRNGNVLIVPTPIPSSLWLRLRLWFLIVISSVMTPTTTPTPTPPLVKTSL